MPFTQYRELQAFLSTTFADLDAEQDLEATRAYLARTPQERQDAVLSQLKRYIDDAALDVADLGQEANRWFAEPDEARAWLRQIQSLLEGAQKRGAATPVKDSNGALLAEGDSVQVIKDLKVKGGSSDLKRGTVIKKIHLIDDPEAIECRVEGSTLVLKTCFLKKV